MKDQLTLQRIKLLDTSLIPEVELIYNEIDKALSGNAICRFTHTYRTLAEQAELWAQGRTKPGKIVTKARPGNSYHNYKRAIDVCLLIDTDGNGTYEKASWDRLTDFDGDRVADWQEIVSIFKRYGWEWGGDWHFKDYPHFQKTGGYSIEQLKNLYPKGMK